jgi:hypothetical protein
MRTNTHFWQVGMFLGLILMLVGKSLYKPCIFYLPAALVGYSVVQVKIYASFVRKACVYMYKCDVYVYKCDVHVCVCACKLCTNLCIFYLPVALVGYSVVQVNITTLCINMCVCMYNIYIYIYIYIYIGVHTWESVCNMCALWPRLLARIRRPHTYLHAWIHTHACIHRPCFFLTPILACTQP